MSGKSQNEQDLIIKELSNKIDELKNELPNGEIESLLNDIRGIAKDQKELKNAVDELSDKIMNPEYGIIVRLNKNTEYREMLQGHENTNAIIIEEHQNLVKWKSSVEKFLWILATAVVGLLMKIFFFGK